MPDPTFYSTGNRWERADTQQTVVTRVPDPTTDDNIVLFRFPSAGRVVAAYVHPHATLAAGTANYYQIGLLNGGTNADASGTVSVASQVGGTSAGGTAPGWTADTRQALTINGTATFTAGQCLVLDYDETGTVAPDFSIEIEYRLDP